MTRNQWNIAGLVFLQNYKNNIVTLGAGRFTIKISHSSNTKKIFQSLT